MVAAPTAADASSFVISGQITSNGTSGIGNVCVYVETTDFATVFEGSTSSNGDYSVSGITSPGSYVVQADPSCYGSTTSTYAGAFYVSTSASGTYSIANATQLTSASATANVTLGSGSHIGGPMHTDTGANASGVCVELSDGTDGWAYTTTSVNGVWGNTGTAYGDYTAYFDPTCGASQPTSVDAPQLYSGATTFAGAATITVASSLTNVGNVALVKGGVIAGTVSLPANPPAANVCVTIVSSDGLFSYTEETGANGQYAFESLAAAPFIVVYDPTCLNSQSSDFTSSFADVTETASTVSVTSGSTSTINGVLVTHGSALALSPTTATSGTVGSSYSQSFSTNGGIAPLTWSSIALPPGLTISGTTGAVTGTPTAPGVYTATILATDSSAQSVAIAGRVTFTVDAAPTTTTTTTTTPISSTTTTTIAPSTTIPVPGLPVSTPEVSIDTSDVDVVNDATASVPVSCAALACSGSIKLVEKTERKIAYKAKAGKKTVTRYKVETTTSVLGAATFRVAEGKKATERLVLNSLGKSVDSGLTATKTSRQFLQTTVRGGGTTTKAVIVT